MSELQAQASNDEKGSPPHKPRSVKRFNQKSLGSNGKEKEVKVNLIDQCNEVVPPQRSSQAAAVQAQQQRRQCKVPHRSQHRE